MHERFGVGVGWGGTEAAIFLGECWSVAVFLFGVGWWSVAWYGMGVLRLVLGEFSSSAIFT